MAIFSAFRKAAAEGISAARFVINVNERFFR